MKQYQDLLAKILNNGARESNRTGINTLALQGEMLKFDLREGFPAVTTKKLAWKAVCGELIGFLRGSTSLTEFKTLGCNVWDANAAAAAWQDNEYCKGVDDLGRIYGSQWRDWTGIADDGGAFSLDQIAVALDQLRNNPQSRRIIVNAWNAAELDQAALPPCHVLFQLLPRSDGTLHMTMYQRSCDVFLGLPFNIASYALLLELFAAWSGKKAATLTIFLADVHIYENHMDQVIEQLNRTPYPAPKLKLHLHPVPETSPLEYLISTLAPSNCVLEGYQHHDAIKATMAV